MAYKINEDCVTCGICQGECPSDAILEANPYKILPEVCNDCGVCAPLCPVEAISKEE